MIKYEKPTLIVNEELAEGIFMASGDCYTASGRITQKPQSGRGTYCIQLEGKHNTSGSDSHTNDAQTVTVNFSQPVTYGSSGGTLKSGNGTSTIVLAYRYHQNAVDNIGLGSLYVESEAGLSIVSVVISDGH